ncbi:alpha/beta fold hydrolase, partial [Flavobacterium sp. B17]|uniref:alpha/beta fold hydrolase n=1 Tax=Flavobacterium sp. B17 TaxID=95618 RepID=UPI000679D521
MKKTKPIIAVAVLSALMFVSCTKANKSENQSQDAAETTAQTRAEYIEVEPNVRLHVTDLGEGKPVVLIHGYPVSDASWEYQYLPLIKAGYRVIGITLRGFGQSDKPYGKYNYDQFASDIKTVLDKLDIKDATLGGHSMGGAIALHYVAKYNSAHVSKLALFAAAAPVHTKKPDYPYPLFTKEEITKWVDLVSVDRPGLLNTIGERFVLSPTSVSPGIGA